MKRLATLLLAVLTAGAAAFGFAGCNNENKPVILDGINLIEEQYGIAAKKGNDALVSKINEALIAISGDEMKTIADTYDLGNDILVKGDTENPLSGATDDSWNNLVSRKKVIIGYTVFAPIAYEIQNEVPTKGYDIELAKAVFDYLNEEYSADIEIEFLEIDWNAKETLLAGGSIDLIWNGLTITDSRLQEMSLSVPYLKNRQVALVMSNNAEKYGDIESLKDAIAGAEDGSAGEEQIELKGIGKEYVKCESQLDAYNKLKTGTLDVIVIDSVMANYYISLEK